MYYKPAGVLNIYLSSFCKSMCQLLRCPRKLCSRDTLEISNKNAQYILSQVISCRKTCQVCIANIVTYLICCHRISDIVTVSFHCSLKVGDIIHGRLLVANKHMDPELVCIDSLGKANGMGVIRDGGTLIQLQLQWARRYMQCFVRHACTFKVSNQFGSI